MQNLINLTSVLENNWSIVSDTDAPLPAGNILVPGDYWLENRDALITRKNVGVLLFGDANPLDFADDISSIELFAVNFPAFADGRGYSIARMLRERLNYQGEIRAIGDVLIDQLNFMKRCGFSEFLLKDGLSGEKALDYFATFSDPYQLANDLPTPLFRRKA